VRGLRIMIGAARGHEQDEHGEPAAQLPEGIGPKMHYTAILLAKYVAHTARGV
jgi:hypothetical protein